MIKILDSTLESLNEKKILRMKIQCYCRERNILYIYWNVKMLKRFLKRRFKWEKKREKQTLLTNYNSMNSYVRLLVQLKIYL